MFFILKVRLLFNSFGDSSLHVQPFFVAYPQVHLQKTVVIIEIIIMIIIITTTKRMIIVIIITIIITITIIISKVH